MALYRSIVRMLWWGFSIQSLLLVCFCVLCCAAVVYANETAADQRWCYDATVWHTIVLHIYTEGCKNSGKTVWSSHIYITLTREMFELSQFKKTVAQFCSRFVCMLILMQRSQTKQRNLSLTHYCKWVRSVWLWIVQFYYFNYLTISKVYLDRFYEI